jgi:hypothetical protein
MVRTYQRLPGRARPETAPDMVMPPGVGGICGGGGFAGVVVALVGVWRRRPTLPPWWAVPLALAGLTSGFGMGPGVAPPLWRPSRCVHRVRLGPCVGVGGGWWVARVSASTRCVAGVCVVCAWCVSSPRPISTSRLRRLPDFHVWPINPVVCWGPYHIKCVGDLILEWASRLDAFSAYPVRTWLTSGALGRTTGTLEVRPSRSSRTRDSVPQISYAHGG